MPFKLPDFGKGIANFTSFMGLFNNDAKEFTKNLKFPINPLVTDYNIGKDLFKVKIKAKRNKNTSINDDGGKTIAKDSELKTFNMEILYSNPSLSVSHSFDWGEGIFATMAEGASTLARGLKKVGEAKDALLSPTAEPGQLGKVLGQSKVGGLEIAPIFKGSTKPSITLDFILLAHSDPYLEVVLPAQIITYLAYPKVSPNNNIGVLVDMLNGQSTKLTSTQEKNMSLRDLGGFDVGKNAEGKADGVINEWKDAINKTKDSLDRAFPSDGGDNWRFLLGEQPDFWEIETSNGIMDMKYAHISALNITYNSPWVAPVRDFGGNYSNSLQFANAVKSIVESGAQGGESGVASMVQSIFPNALDLGKSAISKLGGGIPGPIGDALRDFSGEMDYGFKGGYPSYANVSITFTSNYEKMFGEDWITNGNKPNINVTKGQAGNAIFGAANSIIKNTFK